MIPATLIVVLFLGCAKQETNQAPELSASQREAAISSAMELLQTDQVPEALAITSTLIAKDPMNAESQEVYALALIARGWKLQERRDAQGAQKAWDEALTAYMNACNYSSNPGLLELSTGQLAQMLQNDELAIVYYKNAHLNNKKDARAAFYLSQIYLLNKDWVSAKNWLTQSLLRTPNEPFALLSLALAEAELSNCETALRLAIDGCEILPSDPNIRFVQARVVRLCGNSQHAHEILLSLPIQFQQTALFQEELENCKLSMSSEDK
jgi:tetratricopeptide (TPR) repeat protein